MANFPYKMRTFYLIAKYRIHEFFSPDQDAIGVLDDKPRSKPPCPKIENIAEALINLDGFKAKILTQNFFLYPQNLKTIRKPQTDDPRVLALTACLLEFFAQRHLQEAPEWTKEIGPLDTPVYLDPVENNPYNKWRCDTQPPPTLAKRNFLAPPGFLSHIDETWKLRDEVPVGNDYYSIEKFEVMISREKTESLKQQML